MNTPPFRPMKYPYTLTAKLAQFPYRYYFKNSWFYRYSIYSTILLIPLFYQIQKLSYSPANVEKWKKIRQEMYDGPSHH